MTENSAPHTVLPSGRYGVVRREPTKWDGFRPTVQVLQLVGGETWGPTPARYAAEQAVTFSGPVVIDLGSQWILAADDVAALAEFADDVLRSEHFGW